MNNKSGTKFFVKPLYKNPKSKPITKKGRVRKKTLVVDIDSTINLSGHDFYDKSHNIKSDEETKLPLPGLCEIKPNSLSIRNKNIFENKVIRENTKSYENQNSDCADPNNNRKAKIIIDKTNNIGKINEPVEMLKNTQETNIWLRVYPATRTKEESLWSVIFRCIFCQFGLISFLVLWTVIGVFTIHYYEGPNEVEVSSDFESKQNQLVIDLATELRQIVPVSIKWKETIERRLEEERHITLQAVAKGAMLNPGRFWNLSGTFLFTIFVMTTLGFGAPVPHTIGGRILALVYALFAVPTHFSFGEPSFSDMNRMAFNKKRFSCKLIKILGFLWTGRGLPLVTILYYAMGAITFGFLRNKTNTETAMFPLEFTTTGGLEHVPPYLKVLYGFYVEGAIMLIASIVATMRRCSLSTVDKFFEKYRLYYIKNVSTTPISKSKDDGVNLLPR